MKGHPGKWSYPNHRCKKAATADGDPRLCGTCQRTFDKHSGARFFGYIQDPPPETAVMWKGYAHNFLGGIHEPIPMPSPHAKYASKWFEGRDSLPWLDEYMTACPMEHKWFETSGILLENTPEGAAETHIQDGEVIIYRLYVSLLV